MKKEFGLNLPFEMSCVFSIKGFNSVLSEKPTINFYLYSIRANTELRGNELLIISEFWNIRDILHRLIVKIDFMKRLIQSD